MADPLIGRVLGDYQILELMGHGGMARVYKGYDPKLQRFAAVKVTTSTIVPEELQDEYETRFIREARAIARLNHPNIVGIYQSDQHDGINFMAMHFIGGQDLRFLLHDFHERGQIMSDTQILAIIRDIASALDYAHAHGVIHRDIKPSNIMVTPEGTAILTDFGLALNVPEGTVGRTFGSAHYIAPEQAISSAKSVPQSDLYSLGVVLYEMATGKVPFDDPSTMGIALKHLNDPPPLPSTINPAINPHVETVILQLLRKHPEDRYADGAALVTALEHAIAEGPSPADFSSETQPLPPLEADPAAPDDSLAAMDAQWRDDSWDNPTTGLKTLQVAPAAQDSTPSPPASAPPRRRRWGLVIMVGIVALVAGLLLATSTGVIDGSDLPVLGALLQTTPETTPTTAIVTAPGSPTASLPTMTSSPPPSTPTTAPTIPPTATEFVAAVDEDADLLVLYDADSVLLVNQTDSIINISGLEFRQEDPTSGAARFFRTEDLVNGIETPDALRPRHCFQLLQMGITTPASDQPYDQTVCDTRVGWRLLSDARWFWIGAEPTATFDVRGFGRVLTECSVSARRCTVDLP